jgi:CBS domain-containing protein
MCDIFFPFCTRIIVLRLIFRLTASDVMSKNVVVLYPATRVSSIVRILKTNAHNAFPVVTVKDKTTEVITYHLLLCVCILSKR